MVDRAILSVWRVFEPRRHIVCLNSRHILYHFSYDPNCKFDTNTAFLNDCTYTTEKDTVCKASTHGNTKDSPNDSVDGLDRLNCDFGHDFLCEESTPRRRGESETFLATRNDCLLRGFRPFRPTAANFCASAKATPTLRDTATDTGFPYDDCSHRLPNTRSTDQFQTSP